MRVRGGVVALVVAVAWPCGGQEPQAATVRTAAQADPTEAVRERILGRKITLRLDGVTLKQALDSIAVRGQIRVAYAQAAAPLEKRVSLVVDTITIGDALRVLLRDTQTEVSVSANGLVMLRHAEAARSGGLTMAAAERASGSIAGTITDSVTGASVPYVIVRVEETGQSVTAGSQGRYAIGDLAPGEYRVTARRVGYTPKTRPVIVQDAQVTTLDFKLNQPPTKLDEVVTTAVGDQRRYQVGNSIATINIDSIAPTAPVTSLTDLISARAPGVEVLENSGMTGTGETIRIRGLSSLVLQNNPILIVDGVRQDNSETSNLYGAVFTPGYYGDSHPTPSRINDIDFADVETVDILKGPAASTEYGTDAANGVIVITTKHGTSGRPQWHLSAEQTESQIPVSFANGYYSWGHLTDGSHSPVDCRLNPLYGGQYVQYGPPYNTASTLKTCAVDSVTRWNPLNHAATTIFGTGSRAKYDASVSGGSDAVRYYVSGGLSNESGMIRMPSVFKQLADSLNIGLPNASFNANTEQQRSVRVNTAIRLSSAADLSATASYLSTFQQTPDAGQLYEGVLISPALSDRAHYYGYDGDVAGTPVTPLGELTALGSQNTDRVTGGLTATWRPTGWFVAHATLGLDHGSQRAQDLLYPLTDATYSEFGSGLTLIDATTDVYSTDLRSTITVPIARGVRSLTSLGAQSVDTRIVGQSGVNSITQTNLTLDGGTSPNISEQGSRQATLGAYAEEQVGFADRLFLTGAIRVDAASGFGAAYNAAAYPKASVSWLAVSDGPTTVRLRGAFGESGVQPANGAALLLFTPGMSYIGGTTVGASTISWPGNPNLQPERSAEFEGGADIGAWGNRVSLELTGYSKTTHDALVNVPLGATLGNFTYQENIGEVRNSGFEASLSAGIIASRAVAWDVTINAAINHNTLVSLAPGVLSQVVNYAVQYRQSPGYPLYGLWAPNVKYADANHDGIIESSEVTVADSNSYQGPSLPTREVSLGSHAGFWHNTITIGALFDYRGGYRIANGVGSSEDAAGSSQGANDPKAPLWLQARAASGTFTSLNIEDGSYVRFRELSLTYALPARLIRSLRLQSLSLTAAVRNLALWTKYTGSDPETTNAGSGNIIAAPTSNGATVNNDARFDGGAVPLARYWVVRLNVGL
jgi:TonB-linked SusC/RagA family outer membrane protein